MFRLFATVAVLLGGYSLLSRVDALGNTVTLAGISFSFAFLLAVALSYMTFAKLGRAK